MRDRVSTIRDVCTDNKWLSDNADPESNVTYECKHRFTLRLNLMNPDILHIKNRQIYRENHNTYLEIKEQYDTR